MKEKYFSIATIYNEWFRLGTYTRILPGGIYSFETLCLEWRNNNNSISKKKLSRFRFIATTIETLASSTGKPDIIVFDALEEMIPKTKRSLFGTDKFIKQLQKGGKLNGIDLKKILRKIWLLMKLGCQMIFFMYD